MMNSTNQTNFSKEIIEFSKILDKTFKNISIDVKILNETMIKMGKNMGSLVNKTEINLLKKDLLEMKTSVSQIRSLVLEVKKTSKKTEIIRENTKVVKKNEDLRDIYLEISELKASIKDIEKKLKMN